MKKRKNFKGMTLMEIIISLAILAVLTLVLVQTSNVINMYIRSAKNVNQKTVAQAPVAEMGHKNAAKQVATKSKMITVSGSANGKSFSIDLNGEAYEVGEPATEIVVDEDGNDVVVEKNELGGNLNMQFIDIETPTAPPTSSTTPTESST